MHFDPGSLSVAVLSNNPSHLSLDKGVLVRMKFQAVRVYPSLEKSLAHLRSGQVHIALIDSSLADMDGVECLRRIASDRKLSVKALVMVTSQSTRDTVMAAVSAGCSGYVIRPYSLDTLEKHMRASWNSLSPGEIEEEMLQRATEALARRDYDLAIEEFEEVVEEKNDALKYFNLGMEYLRAKSFGKAILSFNKALALNALYAEAHRGLAYAHQGKGDSAAYREHLRQAADLFAIQDKLNELKEIFVEILKDDPDAVNPYNTLGVKLRRGGDYLGALHAYGQALKLTPEDENLHYNIAKAYLYSGDKNKAVDHLRQAVALRGDFREASGLIETIANGKTEAEAPAVVSLSSGGSGLLID